MYQIEIKRSAEKDMRRLPRKMFLRIRDVILSLQEDPRPAGVRKLQGSNLEGWRIRVGQYRIVYQIDDTDKLITVFRVRHRRDVYR